MTENNYGNLEEFHLMSSNLVLILLVHRQVRVVEVSQEQKLRFCPCPIWLDIKYLYQELLEESFHVELDIKYTKSLLNLVELRLVLLNLQMDVRNHNP